MICKGQTVALKRGAPPRPFFPVKAAADSTFVFLHLFSLTISLADFGQEVLKYDLGQKASSSFVCKVFFTVTDQVVKLQYSKSRTATNFDDCLTSQKSNKKGIVS